VGLHIPTPNVWSSNNGYNRYSMVRASRTKTTRKGEMKIDLCEYYTTTEYPNFKPKCRLGRWASLKCHRFDCKCPNYKTGENKGEIMDVDEVKLKMELAVQKIKNPDLRQWVQSVLSALPDKAWQREASLKYHHPDERGPGGNKLHEIRVAALADLLAFLYNLNSVDRDMVYAASLLHDACRHGLESTENWTVKNHANLVRTFIEEKCEESVWTLPICSLIETHMSRWGEPSYQPEIPLRDIVVLADFIASQPNVKVHE